MASDTQTAPVSKKGLLAGRIISGLVRRRRPLWRHSLAWVGPSTSRRFSGPSYWCLSPSTSSRSRPFLGRSCSLVILVALLRRTFASAIHCSAMFCSPRMWECCSGVVSICANPGSALSSRCELRRQTSRAALHGALSPHAAADAPPLPVIRRRLSGFPAG